MSDSPDASGIRVVDRLLLIRHITGQSTPAESAVIRAWLAADRGNAQTLDSLRAVWEALDATPASGAYDVEGGWNRLHGTVETSAWPPAPGLALHRPGTTLKRSVSVVARLRAALGGPSHHQARVMGSLCAACAIGVAGGLLWRTTRGVARTGTGDADVREVATGNGQRASLELADGSRVVLGVRSVLRTPRHFATGARDVDLDGEAYFDVHHDAAHPFRVHAGGVVMEDLGTRFGVRAYAGDAGVQVVVAEGRVAVGSADTGSGAGPSVQVSVGRGQLVQLSRGSLPAIHHVDPAIYLAWTDGRLVFDGAPLRDALAELGRWYDLDVRLADPRLGGRHVTGSFTDEPVTDVLQVIASAVGLRYERRGAVVTFFSPRAP